MSQLLAQNDVMIRIHPAGYFITGSDTGVGKTYIACELIRQLRGLDVKLETRKPVESGCSTGESGGLIPVDALELQAANNNLETINRIAPYRFKAALAPPRAAALEDCHLQLVDLYNACSLDNSNHRLIVEGAGGFYSPLAENGLNADLASLLQLAVIVVINDRIGAVNQALMTIQAVESRHLDIAAIIMNQVDEDIDKDMANSDDLRTRCDYSIFSCGYNQKLEAVFG
ncbi:MAG: dethiobiotin synthase [Proteobacteria bacterium]|nr:dethiobiotin synthase [Pseudomonadota bacterium]